MRSSNGVLLFTILLLINAADGTAQVILNSGAIGTSQSFRFISDARFNFPTEEKIEGTPYFTDSYTRGNVYSKNVNFSGIEMQYNIFYDQIEFKRNDSVYAISPDPTVKKIELGDKTFIIGNYELKGKMIPGFFLRLDSGRITLVAKMLVAFKAHEAEKPMQDAKPAKYERIRDVYYYKFGNGPLIKIVSLKKMIENLPDRKQEMEEFAKTEKISAKNPEELTKFVRYYNSLR